MKILIIENEIYLAQSISTKLTELGNTCEVVTNIATLKDESYDVVLLSTNISDQNIYQTIETYKDAVIILMISYISNDTVSKPLQAGANDYILKPFMIEELIRKIEHFQEFEKMKKEINTYKRYLEHNFRNVNIEAEAKDKELPLIIFSNYQKHADHYAFRYAYENLKELLFLSVNDSNIYKQIDSLTPKQFAYICDFNLLKKSDKNNFLEFIKEKNVILSSTDIINDIEIDAIKLHNDNKIFDQGDILPIEDYVKYIVLNYQSKYPDTELSKKLGISRKSLWEKRKKYGIIKKK